jgi:hypothetical protein
MKHIITTLLLALAATSAFAQSNQQQEGAFSNDHNFVAPPP